MKYTHEQIREIIESDLDDADTFVAIIEQLLSDNTQLSEDLRTMEDYARGLKRSESELLEAVKATATRTQFVPEGCCSLCRSFTCNGRCFK